MAIVAASFSALIAGFSLLRRPRTALDRWAALWVFVYGLEALCEAVVLTAADAATFWWAYRASRVFLAVLQPLSVAVSVVLAGTGRRGWFFLVGPLALGALMQVFQILFGSAFIVGYQTGPWGNVGLVPPPARWLGLETLMGVWTALANLTTLGWSWIRHPARPYRAFLREYLGLQGAALAVVGACVGLWTVNGMPDLTFVFGIVAIGGLAGLLARYPFLMDHHPSVDPALLRSLKTALFVLDGRGQVIHASRGAVDLLGRPERKMERKTLGELLGPWLGIAELEQLKLWDKVPDQPLEGTLGTNRFRLTLTPSLDRFGQVQALYARLDPVSILDKVGQRFGLSPREKEVAALVAEGMSTQEMAGLLFISVATVKNHLHSLFQKTGTLNRVELVRLMSQEG